MCDGLKVTEKDVDNLASWNANNPGSYEIPFTVARIVLQDLTGVPLLVDLAAMRSAVAGLGKTPPSLNLWSPWTWWWTTPSRWTGQDARMLWKEPGH